MVVVACLASTLAYGGVTAERTRVIVHEGQRETSLALVNQNDYPVVVQTWVDNGDIDVTPDTATAPVMPLPPMFRLEPQQQRSIRLLITGQDLAQDRESLYWLNIYEIPPRPSDELGEGATRLTITLRTQMKVIYRPHNLSMTAEKAPSLLVAKAQGRSVQLYNPTPFYISIAEAKIGDGKRWVALDATLLTPFSTQRQTVASTVPSEARFHFSWLDDDGNAQSAERPVQYAVSTVAARKTQAEAAD
ncbi:fimbrial biogenesis chaperone [Pseudomonas juntendi]|uniref:Molecular chaperone n=1 Tax=Pseudomonas juntendi TaxID=2666183 RepID=A0A7W2JLE2_9PSED|nr:molecular chaperone [Pseudomonas juntendi]MBA6061148.1 molecular chaperone [Pseudomonas juntendi]MBA6128294.1 molecular chaperone [Pseudomonas juntendi]